MVKLAYARAFSKKGEGICFFHISRQKYGASETREIPYDANTYVCSENSFFVEQLPIKEIWIDAHIMLD